LSIAAKAEEATIAATPVTATTSIPANSLVIAVSVRVIVQPPDTTTFDCGVLGAATRYGGAISSSANTTNPGTNDGIRFYSADTQIRITPNVTPTSNAGRIRVTIHYITVTPPTS